MGACKAPEMRSERRMRGGVGRRSVIQGTLYFSHGGVLRERGGQEKGLLLVASCALFFFFLACVLGQAKGKGRSQS